MTRPILEEYKRALSNYTEELLEATAARLVKAMRAKKTEEDSAEFLLQTLSNEKNVSKIIARLDEPERRALGVLIHSPHIAWRWDHAVRLLSAAGVISAYTALQELLGLGLCFMRRANADDPLGRFDVVTGTPPEGMPRIALAAPLFELPLDLPMPVSPLVGQSTSSPWRSADGWEWPMRLALLWQAAWLSPIKRTQQKLLFKRDKERLTLDPLLAADTLDSRARIPEPGFLTYELAMDQTWLDPLVDEQSPTAPLGQFWPDDLSELLLLIARGLVTSESWNELGDDAPVGTFSREVVVARFLILLWLRQLPAEEGTGLEGIARALEGSLAPWNGEGELVGQLRQAKDRAKITRDWVRGFLLGPMYQAKMVEIADGDPEMTLVRLSTLGRRFLGESVDIPIAPKFPQALIVQPNHQVIVYRQALSVELLAQIVLFAEPRSAGAAMTFEITPSSIYHGLEAGLTTERILELLHQNAGRPVPIGVEESVRTWSQKRERLTIHQDASLFEFVSPADMQNALDRGLMGTPVTDRILLIDAQEGAFSNLKITSSRDYRLEPQPCVETGPDGITLSVDLEKSDLMLESEIRRLADPVGAVERSSRLLFAVSPATIERAFDQGLRNDFIEQWFRQRTGKDAPESIRLLLRAAGGLNLSARQVLVVSVESPLVADGLMQHPATADLFSERLGPAALTVDVERISELRAALAELGITISLTEVEELPTREETSA